MSAGVKKSIRASLKDKRLQLSELHPDAGEKAVEQFFSFFAFPLKTIFGVYWPMGTEIDSRPLLNRLFIHGYVCALPRVTSSGLIFHEWEPSLLLEKGKFGIEVPPQAAPVLEPEIVIVPLLGFDRGGHRIGYGKGHYDQYLHHHNGIFIGLCFAGQEVRIVPHEPHDIRLHFILTEEEVIVTDSRQ